MAILFRPKDVDWPPIFSKCKVHPWVRVLHGDNARWLQLHGHRGESTVQQYKFSLCTTRMTDNLENPPRMHLECRLSFTDCPCASLVLFDSVWCDNGKKNIWPWRRLHHFDFLHWGWLHTLMKMVASVPVGTFYTHNQSATDKQRVLMHGHQGWNVRHGLCHIYMRYVYINELFIAFVSFVVCSLL